MNGLPYTVSVALIRECLTGTIKLLGVVYSPVTDSVYYACDGRVVMCFVMV